MIEGKKQKDETVVAGEGEGGHGKGGVTCTPPFLPLRRWSVRVRVCDTADGGGGGSKRMFTTFSSVSALYKNVRPNVGGFLLFFFLKNIVRLKNLV